MEEEVGGSRRRTIENIKRKGRSNNFMTLQIAFFLHLTRATRFPPENIIYSHPIATLHPQNHVPLFFDGKRVLLLLLLLLL